MAHRGLFSRKVVKSTTAEPLTAPPVKSTSPRSSAGTKSRWGSPEEKYRRLCMQCLMCRMSYYVHSKSIVSDDVYDELEKTILQIEDKHRELLDPKYSPTGRPGSDNEGDYPRSVQFMCDHYKDDSDIWERVERAVISFIEEARQDFGLEDSKNQKNLSKTS